MSNEMRTGLLCMMCFFLGGVTFYAGSEFGNRHNRKEVFEKRIATSKPPIEEERWATVELRSNLTPRKATINNEVQYDTYYSGYDGYDSKYEYEHGK